MSSDPAENLQQYLAATTAAFGTMAAAWTQAVMGIYEVVVEWAEEEQVFVGPSATKVFVRVTQDTTLAAQLHDVRDATVVLPKAQVAIDPPKLKAMTPQDPAATVVVTVTPATGCAPAYVGELVDAATGAVVERDVYVSMMAG